MLPVTFGALDGEATWRAEEGVEVGPHRLAAPYPTETTRPALFTALRTGFAEALLREAFVAVRDLRARRRQERGLRRAKPLSAWASCWWWRPTRSTRGAISRSSCGWIPRQPGRARGAAGDLRHAAARMRPSPPSGCGRSRRSWSRWRWPMRGWTCPRSPWWRR